MNSITPRPDFHGPDDFVNHVVECLSSGHESFAPANIAELHAALERERLLVTSANDDAPCLAFHSLLTGGLAA